MLQIALFVGIGVAAAKLANDRRRLHRLAITDDLTGLHNLRSFEGQLRTLLRNAVVYQLPVALLVLDLDRLKSLNDTHGHLAGAEAVRSIGHLIAGCLPAGGVACRYGGDEFVVGNPTAMNSGPSRLPTSCDATSTLSRLFSRRAVSGRHAVDQHRHRL